MLSPFFSTYNLSLLYYRYCYIFVEKWRKLNGHGKRPKGDEMVIVGRETGENTRHGFTVVVLGVLTASLLVSAPEGAAPRK